jgi:hypothetical protein
MWAIVLIIMVLGSPDIAESQANILERLLAAKSLKCSFPVASAVDWDTGRPKVSTNYAGKMPMHFDSINWKDGKARLIGTLGAGDVGVLASAQGLTFTEKTGAGNFIFTTVMAYYDKEADFVAVSSRHMILLDGKPFPSQNYGSCKIWD